jgi:hypothetical protein
MNLRNNATVGGNLSVTGGADFTGPVKVLAKGATAVGDLTNAALVVTGSSNDGTQGITVNSFAPTVAFIDRDADSTGFRLRANGNSLRLDVDGRDNGVTWKQDIALFGDKGHLALGGGGDSTGRMLTLGNTAPGKGNMSGATQIAAMAYANIGADATTRGIGFGVEMSVGDGNTGQTVADVVEFWGNSNVVNTNAAVALMSSFRSYDKASTTIATAYGFDGRQMALAGKSRWNLFMQGTAPNYLRGQTLIGGTDTTLPGSQVSLSVTGNTDVKGALTVFGDAFIKSSLSILSATPYIDFNSSTAATNDYDARIIVDPTTATTSGQATMHIAAGNIHLMGAATLSSSLSVKGYTLFEDVVDFKNRLFVQSHINIGNLGTGEFAGSSAAINIGDSDSGIICPSDGILDFYANNSRYFRLDGSRSTAYFDKPIVSGHIDNYRIIANGYGAFQRFDGNTHYFMFTNQNDPYGQWNDLRPLYFNCTTGNVNMGHQLNVAGSVVCGDRVYTGNGGSFVAADGNVYGGVWGGFLSSWVIGNFVQRGSGDAVQDIRLAGEGGGILNGTFKAPGGCVFTGWYTEGSSPGGDTIFYRAIQKAVAGNWFTIGQL